MEKYMDESGCNDDAAAEEFGNEESRGRDF